MGNFEDPGLAALLGVSYNGGERDDDSTGIEISYFRSLAHRFTFSRPKVKSWVESALEGHVLNLYAGPTQLDCPNIVTNDIDEAVESDYTMDAQDFIVFWKDSGAGLFNTVILDPPYTERKAMQKYRRGTRSTFQAVKEAVTDILYPGAVVISFGYASVCMGKLRGFATERIALICHGGSINDTIGVAERWIVNPKDGKPF